MAPFTEEEKAQILSGAEEEYGEIWTLDFQDPKMETPKPRGKLSSLRELKDFNKKEEEEVIKEACEENVAYEILSDYLQAKGQDQQTINQTIKRLIKQDLDIFLMTDVEKQFGRTIEKNESEEGLWDFPKYFADGLKKLSVQSKASKQYQQEKLREYEIAMQKKQERAKNMPYYNWLNAQ